MLFQLRGGFIAFANTLGLLMNMQEEEISIVNINLDKLYTLCTMKFQCDLG
jgi:hypothetical protein